MKLFLRLGLTAIVITLFFSAAAVTETKAQGVLNEILKRMDANNKTLVSMRSNVAMAKYNSQLDETDMTEGSLIYLPAASKRQMLIRIDWKKPVQESLAVVEGQYTLFRPRLNQAIIGKADQSKGNAKASGALAFVSMSRDQLQSNYKVIYLGTEKVSGGFETWRLELTPKTDTSYKFAELWVDGNGMPIQAKVTEKNNDTTTVLLSNMEKNATINASVFSIKLPKNVKRVNG